MVTLNSTDPLKRPRRRHPPIHLRALKQPPTLNRLLQMGKVLVDAVHGNVERVRGRGRVAHGAAALTDGGHLVAELKLKLGAVWFVEIRPV